MNFVAIDVQTYPHRILMRSWSKIYNRFYEFVTTDIFIFLVILIIIFIFHNIDNFRTNGSHMNRMNIYYSRHKCQRRSQFLSLRLSYETVDQNKKNLE